MTSGKVEQSQSRSVNMIRLSQKLISSLTSLQLFFGLKHFVVGLDWTDHTRQHPYPLSQSSAGIVGMAAVDAKVDPWHPDATVPQVFGDLKGRQLLDRIWETYMASR